MKTTKFNIFILLTTIAILFSCAKSEMASDNSGTESGKASSYARFAIVGDYLYTVTNSDMKLFNVEDETNPIFSNDIEMGWGIETIFPKDDFLFIGTQDGMIIYSIENASSPQYVSTYQHITSCDPVVVEGIYAWVTLHTNDDINDFGFNQCGNNNVNELHLVDISNVYYPKEVQTYQMTKPLGLGVDSSLLFLCDAGLKVYNIENAPNIELIQQFTISANDVIPLGELLLVAGDDGLYQYSYAEGELEFVSKIEVCNANDIY